MLPPIVERQVSEAEAVAAGLRDTAGLCTSGQEALRTRFLQGAHAIDTLAALARCATWVAKLNHDTIVNREAS